MTRHFLLLLAGMLALAPARAAEAPVKIGIVTTLSGPGGYLGEDARDGFLLAVKTGHGTLGGVPVDVLVEDDGLKPANGKQIADRMLKTDGVRIFTGTIFTNVAVAMLGDVLDAGAYWLGPNTAPNDFAGKSCDPHYFVTGWDETLHASAGAMANAMGIKRLFLLAPNYITGKQVTSSVRTTYKGEIVGELYNSLDATDFSAEIAQIRAARPDAVYEFEPGGLGINFLKQWAASGMKDQIPLVVGAPSLDPRVLAAVGTAASNVHVASNWNSDLPNPANAAFVSAYLDAYHRPPTYYAANAYDTANLIGSALKASGGKVDDAFRAALGKADFASIRGRIAFASNQAVKQDWYQLTTDGTALKTVGKVSEMQGGVYADQCRMTR